MSHFLSFLKFNLFSDWQLQSNKGLFQVCLHVPSQSPSLSKYNIVSMEMNRLTDRILSVKRSVTIDTMINFDGDGDRHGDGDGTCK